MTEQMTRWERVRAALKGDKVDRLPVSMWRHFYSMENSAPTLAEAMLGFQDRFDWDFMKVNPRAYYHVEDWGVRIKYDGDSSPRVVAVPVKAPTDWSKLKVLDVNKGVLKEHLLALEMISRELKGEVPFIMTVFTPLSIASRLTTSEEVFLNHLREHTSEVNQALEVITETFISFSKACLERGASGLFYATTSWATTDSLTEEEYKRFAMPSDLKLLSALPPAGFHVLHVCRNNNMLALLKNYPVHAFNWDARGAGNLSLSEGKKILGDRTVIGGMPHDRTLVTAPPEQLAAQVEELHTSMGDRGWMLGSGCTFPPDTPVENLRAIRNAVAF